MIRRLRLLAMGEFEVLSEIATDQAATQQAAIVSAATFTVLAVIVERTVQVIMLGMVVGLFGLAAWTGVLWATSRIVGGKAGPLSMLRVIGYVAPPLALTPIPILGVTAGLGGVALQIVAMKHVAKISTYRAVAAVVPPWIALVSFGIAVRALAG